MTETLPETGDELFAGQPVRVVERDGVRYTLLGTAHVSRASVEAVEKAIDSGRFDAVAVELDPQRPAGSVGCELRVVAGSLVAQQEAAGAEQRPAEPPRHHRDHVRQRLVVGPRAAEHLEHRGAGGAAGAAFARHGRGGRRAGQRRPRRRGLHWRRHQPD